MAPHAIQRSRNQKTCEKDCCVKVMFYQVNMQCATLPGWLHFLQVAPYFWREGDFYNITCKTRDTRNVIC